MDYLEAAKSLATYAAWEPERFALLGLTSEDFPKPWREVVAVAADVHADLPRGRLADVRAVADALSRSKAPETQALGQVVLTTSLPSRANVERLAAELREGTARAALRDGLAAIAGRLEELSSDEAIASLTDLTSEAAKGTSRSRPLSAKDVIERAVTSLVSGRDPKRLVDLGLNSWRKNLGPVLAGSLIVIGGATNVGKSSIALAMLLAASAQGTTCGYISCEDGPDLVGARILSSISGVSSRNIINGQAASSASEVGRVVAAAERAPQRLYCEFPSRNTDADVCVSMTRLAALGCRFVVVDYVQAISAARQQQDRRNEVRTVAEKVKAQAARLGIVAILVSQLQRPSKNNENEEPSKHSLKEAGDLENMAEAVIVAWRESESDKAELRLRLVKSKWGNVGATWGMQRVEGVLHEV